MINTKLLTLQAKLGFAFAVFALVSLGLFVSTASAAGTLLFGATAGPDHVILVSDLSDVPTTNDFSAIKFDDETGNLVSSITSLGTDYNVTDDDCGGGAPRFQIAVDMDGNATTSPADKNIFIYIGPHPNFTGCTPNTWVSTGNLIASPDPRFDTSQIGGTFYDTWANVLALVGNKGILSISIAVDAGWMFGDSEQTVLIDNTDINGMFYDYNPPPPPTGVINSSFIKIEASGGGKIINIDSSKASTGGNDAEGSYGGRGGRGGDVEAEANGSGDANGNNGAATAGDGGDGGDAAIGGVVRSGRATSVAMTNNSLNETDVEIQNLGTMNSSKLLIESTTPATTCVASCVAHTETIQSDVTNTVVGDGPAVAVAVHPAWTASIPGATWIWKSGATAFNETVGFEQTFTVVGTVLSATLNIASDNSYKVFIDGVEVAADPAENNFQAATQDTHNLTAAVTPGTHTLRIEVTNVGTYNVDSNPAGLLYKLVVESEECPPPPCLCNEIDNTTRSRARTGGNDALGSIGGSGGGGGEVEAEANGSGDANGNNGAAVGGNGGAGGTGAASGTVVSGVADSSASTTNRANTTRVRINN